MDELIDKNLPYFVGGNLATLDRVGGGGAVYKPTEPSLPRLRAWVQNVGYGMGHSSELLA